MSDAELARLRWRCRRGMTELDRLLTGWLDANGSSADPDRRAAFARLLEVEDDRLWAWMTGRARPEDERLRRLVDELLC